MQSSNAIADAFERVTEKKKQIVEAEEEEEEEFQSMYRTVVADAVARLEIPDDKYVDNSDHGPMTIDGLFADL